MRLVLVLVLGLGLGLVLDPVQARADTGYELRVPERIALHAGDSGTLAVAIAVDRGRTISKDAALVLDLAPDGALAVKRRRLGRADAVDPDADEPRFQIAVRGESAGDYAIKLHLRFWLCGTKVCRPVDARRTVAVTVQ
ncbi:MAG: hypothetical protein ACM31C_15480 [Acidobacteriota bacterium]